MLEGEAAMLMEKIQRLTTQLEAVTKRTDLMENTIRSIQQALQRQGQAIRSAKPTSG